MFRYTYVGVREMMIQMEKGSRYMNRVMHTLIGNVT